MKDHRWIASRGHRLSAMLHVPDPVCRERPVVMICHGFTGDKVGANQMNVKLATALELAGYAVVRFDYLGSGDSDGDFAADTLVSGWQTDAANVARWIGEQPELAGRPLVVYGHSLGGLIALRHREPTVNPVARILFSPVVDPIGNMRTSILGPDLWQKSFRGEVVANFFGKAFSLQPQLVKDLVENRYEPLRDAAGMKEPLLLVHGSADAVVPIEGSQVLFERYPGPKEMKILEIDHVAAGRHEVWIAAISQWLDRTFPQH